MENTNQEKQLELPFDENMLDTTALPENLIESKSAKDLSNDVDSSLETVTYMNRHERRKNAALERKKEKEKKRAELKKLLKL